MATNYDSDDDNMGFILHPDYRNLSKLSKPIIVTNEWFNRKFYSIRLKEHKASPRLNHFRVFLAGYDIRLHLQNVPPEYVLKALNFVSTKSSTSSNTTHISNQAVSMLG
jgi:hypothetical protein